MNKRTLLKGFIKEALGTEMKLDVAGAQGFEPRTTSFDIGGEEGIDDLEGEDLSCPECGGPPGTCDPMCPVGGDEELGPDPDRYRH